MGFATRSDLLSRSNARRLAQLAVPADMDMPPEESLRVAIAGGDLSACPVAEQAALDAALATIDRALADASALLVSYQVPESAQSTLLARLASTVALYYLYGAESVPKEVQSAYDGVLLTLKSHARGDLALVPADPADPVPSADVATIESAGRRYGGSLAANVFTDDLY